MYCSSHRPFLTKKVWKEPLSFIYWVGTDSPFLIILSTAASRGKKVKATLIDILQKLFYLSTDTPYRISDWVLKSSNDLAIQSLQ